MYAFYGNPYERYKFTIWPGENDAAFGAVVFVPRPEVVGVADAMIKARIQTAIF